MSNTEIVGIIVTILGVGCFSLVFTILYSAYIKSEISDIKSGKKDIELIDEVIYENQSHVKVRRQIIGTIKSILFYGLMTLLIPFFIFSIINKFQGNVTMISDRGVIVVASGSMSVRNKENTYLFTNNLTNQFDQYDLIVIERVDNALDINLYDVISFVNDEGVNVIHRVVGINYNSKGQIEFTTRGDSNGYDAVDKFKPTINDIQGRYIDKKIPAVGMFILFMQSSLGMITIMALAYCLIMMDRLTSKITRVQEKRIEMLCNVLNFENKNDTNEMKTHYLESIYYKGYIYLFNEEGFVDKKEIKDEDVLEKSNKTLIKIVEDMETNESTETNIIIEEDESEEE